MIDNLFELFVSYLIIVLEMCCCAIFYETFYLKRRNSKLISTIIIVMLSATILVLALLLMNNFILKMAFVVAVISVYMFIYLKISMKVSIILAIIYDALLLTTEYIAFLIHYAIEGQYNLGNGQMISILAKSSLFLVVLLIRRLFNHKYSAMAVSKPWNIFFPIFIIIVIIKMTNPKEITNDQEELFTILALGLVGLNVFGFYLTNKEQQRLLEQQKTKNAIDVNQVITEKYNQKSRAAHEFKNHITYLDTLAEGQNYKELRKYLKEISSSSVVSENFINTNNIVINAVLNSKYLQATENNIVFHYSVTDLSEINIDSTKIVVILSNLLSNAIEACNKCDKKQINLQIKYTEDTIFMSVINTHKNNITYKEGEIQTSKMNPEDHGFGIKNIISVTQECGGDYEIIDMDDKFAFFISLPQ